MSKFVRKHRLLGIGGEPVQQIHALGLHVVVPGDLLLKKLDQETVQIEVARQESKLLQHDFRAL